MLVRWFQYILSNVPNFYMRLCNARNNARVIRTPQRRSDRFKATRQFHYRFVHVFDPYSNHPVQKSNFNLISKTAFLSILPITAAGEIYFWTPRRKLHSSHTATMNLHYASILVRIECWTFVQATLVSAHEKYVGLERMNLQCNALWIPICL